MIKCTRNVLFAAVVIFLLGCGGRGSAVHIELPLPPKLDLTTFEQVYFAGFHIASKEEYFDTQYDAINFLKREFKRRADMAIAEKAPLDLSEYEPREFFKENQPLFKNLDLKNRESTLAVTGIINFTTVDRSGFRDVAVTDSQGRQFYRSQFVEVTGYLLEVNVHVYELENGELVYRELLKDAIDLEGPPEASQFVFFELLDRVSLRIIGLFSNTQVKAERQLL